MILAMLCVPDFIHLLRGAKVQEEFNAVRSEALGQRFNGAESRPVFLAAMGADRPEF
jgi:hypothetical protein